MRIGIDFHGVIVDSAHMKAQRAPYYGVNLPRATFLRGAAVGRGPRQLTGQQYHELKVDIYWRPRIAAQVMTPVPGAIRHLKLLMNDGHSLFVVSSSSHKHAKIARRWFKKQGLDVEFIAIGVSQMDKSDTARQYELDVFVDNDLHKLQYLVGVVPKRYLFNLRGMEKQQGANGLAVHVNGWGELYDSLSRLKI